MKPSEDSKPTASVEAARVGCSAWLAILPMSNEQSHWLRLAEKCREQAKCATGTLQKILRAEMRGAALNATRKP